MHEAVRLVVWDLDETFWMGTLTEGGIREYVDAHHDIVVELARRGIMSSICSKNDPDPVLAILREKNIEQYFVFPSISWEPKGPRLAALIQAVGLRAATVMFIDDNASNRGEAASMVPDLQVEDEHFIASMLEDRRFRGKADPELTRLAQYKLLEARKNDEVEAGGGNEAFLRQCDVRLRIEYDVDAEIDRAVELVSRTNQLNYTKNRLPEDMELAREELRRQIAPFSRQAGLVHVMDKYGDYGMVGFFLTETMRTTVAEGAANSRLIHFCFSCRTLGMLIEQWVYDHLRRPELVTVGTVLTDLNVPRPVDWVRLVRDMEPTAQHKAPSVPRIVLWGGCEANAIGLYLGVHTKQLDVYGNYVVGDVFIRLASAAIANDMASRASPAFAEEAQQLGLPAHMSVLPCFEGAEPGTAYVFNCSFDAFQDIPVYRHKTAGWLVHLEPRGMDWIHLDQCSEPRLAEILSGREQLSDEHRARILQIGSHIRQHYENARPFSEADRATAMHRLIARVPVGSRFIIALDHDEVRDDDDSIHRLDEVSRYAAEMRRVAAEYDFVGVVSFSDVLAGQSEIQSGGGSHYDRQVYLRFAERVMAVLEVLPPRAEAATSSHPLLATAATEDLLADV